MKNSENIFSVFVLAKAHYQSALNELNEARNGGRMLFTACELLEEKLRAGADKVHVGSLVPGKRYGYFGVSPSATANRNGKMVPNHGEISATYQESIGTKNNVLVSESAWGNIVEKMVRPGMLLVEL